jgi:hypothetical protein
LNGGLQRGIFYVEEEVKRGGKRKRRDEKWES